MANLTGLTFTEENEQAVQRETFSAQVREAFARVRKLVVYGLVLGLTLVGQEVLLEPLVQSRPVLELLIRILREVGMGFIVAAIAVFGYELSSHITGSVTETRRLAGL